MIALRKIIPEAVIESTCNYLTKKQNLLMTVLLFVIFEMVFRPFFPGHQNLISDWANFTVYLSFFLLGYFIAHKIECIEIIEGSIPLFAVISAISTICFVTIKYNSNDYVTVLSDYGITSYGCLLIQSFFQGIAEFSLVLFFVGFFKRYFNSGGRIYVYLSKTSFALYIFHFVILTIFASWVIGLQLNDYTKYILLISLTYCIFFVLFELIIKRLNILRVICGIKK